MSLDKRFIFTIAAAFVLQAALCPAVCVAESPDGPAAAEAARAAADSARVPSRAEGPCHTDRQGAPQDVPADSDDSSACSSCSAEAPVAYPAEKVSHSLSFAVIAYLPAITPRPRARFLTPLEPDHGRPPARLYLLKNSFLL